MSKNVLTIVGVVIVIGTVVFLVSSDRKNSVKNDTIGAENDGYDALSLGYSTSTNIGTNQRQQNQTNSAVTNQNSAINNSTSTKKIMNATLHTNKGDITIEFYGTLAPVTVENFTKLAMAGFYDGVKFHRVIEGFMIQGGDPLSKNDADSSRWGTGGPGYTFKDEIHAQNKNNVGTISMANAGPNTNGSQFFINVANNNFLDTKHTVFGKVTKGLDVVEAISTTPTNGQDRPIDPVIIKNITLK